MKVVTLLGSPKKHGCTAEVLEIFEKLIAEKEHSVERINVIDHSISPCQGCMACQKVGEMPGCVIPDEGQKILRRLAAADTVVYATPLYGWTFTAQFKPLLDRQWSMATGSYSPQHRSVMEGKRLALLVTCGGPAENNADLIQTTFDRFVAYAKAGSAYKYVVPGTFELKPDLVRNTAAKMAAELGAA